MRWVNRLIAARYKQRQKRVLDAIAELLEARPPLHPSQETPSQSQPKLHASRLP